MNCYVCREAIVTPVNICCQNNVHPSCAIVLLSCPNCQKKYSEQLRNYLISELVPAYNNYKEKMAKRKAKQNKARISIQTKIYKEIKYNKYENMVAAYNSTPTKKEKRKKAKSIAENKKPRIKISKTFFK